jgi:hypothetical protein
MESQALILKYRVIGAEGGPTASLRGQIGQFPETKCIDNMFVLPSGSGLRPHCAARQYFEGDNHDQIICVSATSWSLELLIHTVGAAHDVVAVNGSERVSEVISTRK